MKTKFTPERIDHLDNNEIFVFGSNLSGKHLGGAAKVALQKFGAIMGRGVGLQGNSYAIPTMQGGIDTIKPYVDEFIDFANNHRNLHFYVTKIGCGIAGFKEDDIAPLFSKSLSVPNISLPESFCDIIVRNNPDIECNLEIECSMEMVKLWQRTIHRELTKIATDFFFWIADHPQCLGVGLSKYSEHDVIDRWAIAFHYLKFSSCPDIFYNSERLIQSDSLRLGIRFASVGFKHKWCINYGEFVMAQEIQRLLEEWFQKPHVQKIWKEEQISYPSNNNLREL